LPVKTTVDLLEKAAVAQASQIRSRDPRFVQITSRDRPFRASRRRASALDVQVAVVATCRAPAAVSRSPPASGVTTNE
jgi:hypothetical protein